MNDFQEKKQFIPLKKRSKKEQKKHHAQMRRTWGGINPVTKKPPNPKAYRRKKQTGLDEVYEQYM